MDLYCPLAETRRFSHTRGGGDADRDAGRRVFQMFDRTEP